MASDFSTPISVAATFEDGALVLRPKGLDGVEVRRHREGDELVWQFHTLFTRASGAEALADQRHDLGGEPFHRRCEGSWLQAGSRAPSHDVGEAVASMNDASSSTHSSTLPTNTRWLMRCGSLNSVASPVPASSAKRP